MITGSASEIFDQITFLSRPRPNGSRALEQAVEEVRAWLHAEGIPVEPHAFVLRPYFMELLGLWLALAGLLLPVAALARWGWVSMVLALLAVSIPLLEVRFLRPTLTALVRRPARNLVVHLPASQPSQEVVLCAHLDSKTELLDHVSRRAILKLSRPAVVLALGSGLLVGLETVLPSGTARLVIAWLACAMALPLAIYGLAMGVNLIGGRFSRVPSTGAVDNGAAVAVLLSLARRLNAGDPHLRATSVTLLFTVGEEAQMQGALAYVRHAYHQGITRDVPLVVAVNLEVVGQNGGYLLWQQDGTVMTLLPADAAVNLALARAVEAVAGEHPRRASATNSDAFAFLHRGIPAATLGSYDADLGEHGFHSALDAPARLDSNRLIETTRVLAHFLATLDTGEAPVGA